MGYHDWVERDVSVGGRTLTVVSKAGVTGHGEPDPSVLLLAEHARIDAGDVVLVLNCGTGVVGVTAVGAGAGRVVMTDRSVVAVEAASRTLAANGSADSAEVVACQGGYAVASDVTADVVIIRIPKDRASLHVLLADAFARLRIGGRCYVAGATNEGVKSAAGSLAQLFGSAQTIAHGSGHRVLLSIRRDLAGSMSSGSLTSIATGRSTGDEYTTVDANVNGMCFTLYARPGVFSRDHVDEATALLASAMEIRDGDDVLDLGCGSGVLGLVAASLSPSGRIVMTDADIEAVRSAARSAEAAGFRNAVALPGDVGAAVIDQRFDVVVSNPPFHVGKDTDLDLPLQFIEDAFTLLRPAGRLYLVANRTLPYERALHRLFGSYDVLRDTPRFKVLRATRPDLPDLPDQPSDLRD